MNASYEVHCETCQRPLRFRFAPTRGWTHENQGRNGYDHKAVPLEPEWRN